MSGYLDDLSESQAAALKEMRAQVDAAIANAGQEADETAPVLELSATEKELFADDRILLRFLRARKFDVPKALDMYLAAGKWRRTFHGTGVESITELDCLNELASGKSFFYKYDKEDRLITYVRARYHDPSKTDPVEVQKYTVLFLELGRKLMRLPQENGTIVYDLGDFGFSNMDQEFMKFMIDIMQNYFPESLGLCLVVNAPWIFWTFWNLIQFWIDPVSRQKIKFISAAELPEYIDINDIPAEFGGNDPYTYSYIPPSERAGTGYLPPWEMEWATEVRPSRMPSRASATPDDSTPESASEPAMPATPGTTSEPTTPAKSGWGWW